MTNMNKKYLLGINCSAEWIIFANFAFSFSDNNEIVMKIKLNRCIFPFLFIFCIFGVVKAHTTAESLHFEFTFDGVPVLMDSTDYVMYVSLLPDTPDDFKPVVDLNSAVSDTTVYLQMAYGNSGSWHELPHTFNIKQWPTEEKIMRVKVDGKESTWRLVFTTLPLVDIQVSLTRLKEIYNQDKNEKIGCSIRVIDPQGRANGAVVLDHGAGIKIHAGDASSFSKKPFGLEFRNDSTDEKEDVSLFGIRHDDDWVLDAMYVDLACMRNRVLSDLWNSLSDLPYKKDNEFQRNGMRGEYVEVFIRGKYYGLFSFNDRIDRKKLNLKKTQESEDGSKDVRGLMFRGRGTNDATLLKDYDDSMPTDTNLWNEWEQEYPNDDSNLLRWDVLKGLIDVVGDGNHTDKSRLQKEFNEWFYMDNCVDFYLFLNAFYLNNNTGKNYYLSFRNIDNGHRALFTLCDMDGSLGRNGSGESRFKETERYGFNSSMQHRIGFFHRMQKDNILHFNNRLRSHWDLLKEEQLSVKTVSRIIDKYASSLKRSGAIARESAKWPNAVAENFDEEVQSMKEWYEWNFSMMETAISSYEPYAGQDDPSPSDIIMPKERNYAGYTIRSSHIFVDGIPAVLDVANQTMYVSVVPNDEKKTEITITTDLPDLQLSLDGEQYAMTILGKYMTCNDTTRHLFIRKDDIVVNYKMEFTSFPIVCIDTDWKEVLANMYEVDNVKTDGYLYIIDAQRQTNEQSVYAHRIATRVRGASSKDYDKKSLAVEIRDEETGEVTEDAVIFGIREDDDWILDAMYIDHSRMRNRALTDIWNSFSDLPYDKDNIFQFNGTHGQYVEVIINGAYAGLYCLTDKIDRKKLNLKKTRKIDEQRSEIRGLLYKGKRWTNATLTHTYNIHDEGNDTLLWQGWAQSYPNENQRMATWGPLKDFLELICDENIEGKPGIYYRLSKEYKDYFYLENLVDYWILFNAAALYDNTMKNTFLSIRNLKKTKQMLFTPWDLDASMGRGPYGEDMSESDDNYAFGRKIMYRCGFFMRLMLDNNFNFHTLIHDRWNQLKNDQLSVKSVMSRFKEYAQILQKSGAWRREHVLWPEHVAENIEDEIDFVETFYRKNWDTFENYVKDYPSAIEEMMSKPEELSFYVDGRTLYVKCDDLNNGDIQVIDVTGRCVASTKATQQSWWTVSVAKGVYVIAAKVGNDRISCKIVVR